MWGQNCCRVWGECVLSKLLQAKGVCRGDELLQTMCKVADRGYVLCANCCKGSVCATFELLQTKTKEPTEVSPLLIQISLLSVYFFLSSASMYARICLKAEILPFQYSSFCSPFSCLHLMAMSSLRMMYLLRSSTSLFAT